MQIHSRAYIFYKESNNAHLVSGRNPADWTLRCHRGGDIGVWGRVWVWVFIENLLIPSQFYLVNDLLIQEGFGLVWLFNTKEEKKWTQLLGELALRMKQEPLPTAHGRVPGQLSRTAPPPAFRGRGPSCFQAQEKQQHYT